MSSFKNSAVFAAAALFLAQVQAHGTVTGALADGKFYVGQSHWSTDASAGWKANNGDNGFARSMTDASIICHNDAVPGTKYITIAAGNSMELQWSTWPDSHKGPMLDYLAPCGGDCTTVDPTSLRFTKIDEAGLTGGKWASDEMIANNNTWVTKIPSSIAPGKYVLRHETIALHSAGSEGGAQSYPQCLNIEVTGSGSNALSGGTAGTSLYKTTDPGILINIYTNLQSYVIPGPAVMAGGSGSGSGSGSSSSKPASSAVATSAAATSAAATSAAASSAVATPATSQAAGGSGPKPSSVAVTVIPTTANNVASTTSTSAVATASAGGKRYICYEEL